MTAFEEERIRLREEVWSLLDQAKGTKYVDVGIGHTAHSLNKLIELGLAVTSLDIDLDILRLHRPNAANFVQGNAARMPFKENSFSISLAYFTFHEINPALHKKAVSELCRISRRIIIVEPTIAKDPICRRHQKIMTEATHSIYKYEDFRTMRYWTGLLEKNGAAVVDAKKICPHVRLCGREAKEYIGTVIDNMHEDGIPEKYITKMQHLSKEIVAKGMLFSCVNVIIGMARQ
jgi:ubiquinone/menaquinone biosynthesis C-methylase UbiE